MKNLGIRMNIINQNIKQTKEFFNERADTWDNTSNYNYEKISAIVTLAGIKEGSRVADIACGTGILFHEILSHKPKLLLGVDLSDKMIKNARSKYVNPNLRLLVSDFFNVHETGFDTIFLYNAYPHFLDKSRFSIHMSEMLKTGGRFMIAHGEGRDSINIHHTGKAVSKLSCGLKSAEEEKANFSQAFNIDMIADTDEIYFFSGTKK